MKKRLLSLALVLSVSISMAACGKGEIAQDAEEKRLTVGKPLILGKKTEAYAYEGQSPHGAGKAFAVFDPVVLAPYRI